MSSLLDQLDPLLDVSDPLLHRLSLGPPDWLGLEHDGALRLVNILQL